MGQVFAVHDDDDRNYLTRYRRQGNPHGADVDEVRFDPQETVSNLIRERDVLLKKVKEHIYLTEENRKLISDNEKLSEDNQKLNADNHILRKKGLDSLSTNEELAKQISKLQRDKETMSNDIQRLQRDKNLLGEELKSQMEHSKGLDGALIQVKARNDRLCKRVQELEKLKS